MGYVIYIPVKSLSEGRLEVCRVFVSDDSLGWPFSAMNIEAARCLYLSSCLQTLQITISCDNPGPMKVLEKGRKWAQAWGLRCVSI